MNQEQLTELVLQSLEHEMGGVEVYETAVECAVNHDLREEWQEYLDQTRRHVQILQDLCEKLEIDAKSPTPGREIVRSLGLALVDAMQKARAGGNADAAQLVACECVVLAETKDHLDWELIGMLAENAPAEMRRALKAAHEEVEDEEDEHLYHTTGWTRELWIQSLGMPAVLPPPEEEKEVKTAIGAARAKMARGRMKKAS